MKRSFLLLLLLPAVTISCEKKDGTLDFSSVHYCDVNATPTGLGGAQPDDDYQNENWDPWIMSLFAPLDTADLTGMKQLTKVEAVLYPNYTTSIQSFALTGDTTATNIKVVVIDQSKNVILSRSYSSRGHYYTLFNYSNVPNGFYRFYYALSAGDKPYYYKAHADLEVRKP